MSSIRLLALLAVTLAQSAQSQNASRTTHGDTAVVVTRGNGKWGAPHDAIEVLRVPGDTKETTFGAAYVLQATPDGGVVIFDTKGEEGMIIRQFDASGKFVHNIGRQGPGPGEYMRPNASVAVHPNGSVYVRDDDKSVSVFGKDGKLAHTFALNYNNGSTLEIYAASDGSVYIRAPEVRAMTAMPGARPFFHYSLGGKLLDSISVAAHWVPAPTPDIEHWRVFPDGRLLFMRTDKVGFLISRPGRSALVGEVAAAAVPYLPEEREQIDAARNLFLDKCGGDQAHGGPPTKRVVIGETKPASRQMSVDVDGRIWITKSTTAQKVSPITTASCSLRGRGAFKAQVSYQEPPVFAAFQPDGTYLGEVRFPLRARVTFVGNTAWALVPDADDVLTLVKYRLY
jgi:hypothetical protein